MTDRSHPTSHERYAHEIARMLEARGATEVTVATVRFRVVDVLQAVATAERLAQRRRGGATSDEVRRAYAAQHPDRAADAWAIPLPEAVARGLVARRKVSLLTLTPEGRRRADAPRASIAT